MLGSVLEVTNWIHELGLSKGIYEAHFICSSYFLKLKVGNEHFERGRYPDYRNARFNRLYIDQTIKWHIKAY